MNRSPCLEWLGPRAATHPPGAPQMKRLFCWFGWHDWRLVHPTSRICYLRCVRCLCRKTIQSIEGY